MARLTLHPFDLTDKTAFAEAAERALARREVPTERGGSLVSEERNGAAYFYLYRVDSTGRRQKTYVGLDPTEAREHLADRSSAEAAAKRLRALGFSAADNDTALTLAVLANGGVFTGGAVLVGTHAFGALLNQLGWRLTPSLSTYDVDLAHATGPSLGLRPTAGLATLLQQTGLPFCEVPGLPSRAPSTSFKVRGRPMRVDLLVPAGEGPPYRAEYVPSLGAHAIALPYLDYLLDDVTTAIVVGRFQTIPVTVPKPARFALHKLLVSQLREGVSTPKAEKDILQAAALCAALANERELELEQAIASLPSSMRSRLAPAATRAAALLEPAHQLAAELLRPLCREN